MSKTILKPSDFNPPEDAEQEAVMAAEHEAEEKNEAAMLSVLQAEAATEESISSSYAGAVLEQEHVKKKPKDEEE